MTTTIEQNNFLQISQERIKNAIAQIDDQSIEMIFRRLQTPLDTGLRAGYTMYGCGGIGSNFSHLMPNRMARNVYMAFADPDIIEERNIGRQRFKRSMVGMNKADVTLQLFATDFIRQGNTPLGVAKIEYPNNAMQDWETFKVRTEQGLLFTDSMFSRLGLALMTQHTKYIHAANNATTSFAMQVNATNKIEFLGYLTFLLVHYIEQEKDAPQRDTSCAAAEAEEQTDLANLSAAYSAVEIMSSQEQYSVGAIVHRTGYEKITITKIDTTNMLAAIGMQVRGDIGAIYSQKVQQKIDNFLRAE